jgi:hypothetical protein
MEEQSTQEDAAGESTGSAPEDKPGEPGAEGGSPSEEQLPAAPADDDSELGDTDQHSTG